MDNGEKGRLESRRLFLEELGLGAGTAALFGLGVLSPSQARAQDCAPPGPPGSAAAWRRDCRAIRPRRPASTLSAAEIQKLKSAYQAMRALDTSAPEDPRGFTRQARIHCWNCGQSVQVHGSWQFFAWHRAYLYFHERILGHLIGDSDFRLPYWDWDRASHRRLPGAYTTPNEAANPLWNVTRSMSPTDELPDEDVGEDVMQGVMGLGTFPELGGTASFGGSPEGTPHGSVHVDVGGDMGAFNTAGRDPVFYAHHSNVDKIWSDWNKISPTHTNPVEPGFLDLTFTFYDENRNWRSIRAAEMLDHESRLRYTYGPSRLWEILPCLLDWIVVRTNWRVSRVLEFDPRLREQLDRALRSKGFVRMHLEGLELPLDKSAVYRLYASRQEAEEDRGPESLGYLGSIPVVLNDARNEHPVRRLPNPILNVTRRLPKLLGRSGRVELFLTERATRPGARRILPVRAKDVYFSLAGVATDI